MTAGIKTRQPLPVSLSPNSLLSVIDQADDRILLLRILSPFGQARPLLVAGMGVLPLALGLVPGSALATSINPWLARGALGAIIFLIVGGMYLAVLMIRGCADEIESLVANRRDVRLLIDAVESFYGTIRSQAIWSIGVALFACAVLYQGMPTGRAAGVGDYLILAYLAFVVSNGMYWCWHFADFAAQVARANLQFGVLDPREEYALLRLKTVLRCAIGAISVELACTAVVAWFLQLVPAGAAADPFPWPAGVLTLQLTGLAIMIALLTRFSWALVQLNGAIKREERARIKDLRRKRDAIKRATASPSALARRLDYESELKRLRRSPMSSALDLALAILGPLVPLVLAAVQVILMVSAIEP